MAQEGYDLRAVLLALEMMTRSGMNIFSPRAVDLYNPELKKTWYAAAVEMLKLPPLYDEQAMALTERMEQNE